jgi:regulator of RNase E activity RraB
MFTALLDIIDGDFQNCEVGLSLPYIFSKGKDGMAILDGGSKTIEKIVRFFELCGISLEDEEFSYEDNVLPMLEDILLEVADEHVFQVEIEDGYVKNATDLPTGLEKHYIGKGKKVGPPFREEEDDDDDAEEEPQPRRHKTAQVTDEAESPRRKRQPEPVDEDEDEEEEQPKRKASREPVRETAKPARRQPVVEDDDDEDEEDEEPAKPARRNFRKSSRDEVI